MTQMMIKNSPAMQETWVRSPGWEDPLEKGKATHSSILAWTNPWTIYHPWAHKESDMAERLSLHFTSYFHCPQSKSLVIRTRYLVVYPKH